jgi:organic hydroperoxide reductase OsmC/OhrA
MSEYTAKIVWQRDGATFSDHRYSRSHLWSFDGGATITASASPHVVPLPLSNPAHVDPEEAFIAALSSCHMLWFLAIAAKQAFVVNSYLDQAVGIMEKNEQGKLAITHVKLCPQITFTGSTLPTSSQIESIHELAHESCYIANSVKTLVTVDSTEIIYE